MPFNLLLLPLLGGYIFVRKCYLTSLNVLRYDTNFNRILLPSSIAGIVLLGVAYFLVQLLHCCFPAAIEWWHSTIRLNFPYMGISIVAFLLGAVLWIPLNLFTNYTKQINKAIEKHNDPLERLFQQSFNECSLAFITLKNDKVYIGWITDLPQPGISRYISIVPVISGFRSKDNKKIEFTTHYLDVLKRLFRSEISDTGIRKLFDELPEEEAIGTSANDVRAGVSDQELRDLFMNYRIVISFGDILTATIFDPMAYALFGNSDAEYVASNPVDTAD